jgi:CYTH domain-containing protein
MSNTEIEYKYLVEYIPSEIFINPIEIEQFYIKRTNLTNIILKKEKNSFYVNIKTINTEKEYIEFNIEISREQFNLIKELDLLNPESKSAIRLRQSNNDYFFTIKSKRIGIECVEIEVSTKEKTFKELSSSKAIVGNLIEKERYCHDYKGFTFEVDKFKGFHSGLVLVEVEVKSSQISEPKKPKDWVLELTNDKKYFNQCLANAN